MDIKTQIKVLKDLIEGVEELDGWEDVLEDGYIFLAYLDTINV